MPPSIAARPRRDPPQPLTDDGASSPAKANERQQQTLTDFQARKKLLSNGDDKKKANKKKPTKKAAKTAAKTQSSATTGTSTKATASSPTTTDLLATSAVGLGGAGMYGGGMGMYGGGMMGSPYGLYGGMMGGMGPLNSLNQFLFGVQTAIYSLSSAVQVIGMNTEAFHQLLDAASSMLDHALAAWHEMRALDATEKIFETEEQKMKKRRLKALRWALVVAASYAAYRILRSLLVAKRRRSRQRRIQQSPHPSHHQPTTTAMTPYGYNNNTSSMGMYGGGMYGGPSSGMYGPGGGGYGYGGGGYGYGGGGYY
ncbi:expressed unknown protein [Seminavis robusta]|uniref:Peroxin-13 n=1 Tax=Seminavis robusta TaxID=568900 RepID=A0A9N8HFK1_9STRA|nr:expressed unknown protein [Seminavis robusta]|eukprot:Sro575_g169440.1 n/a (312) ;mRNA; r:57388-58323